jgi:PAP2 superfamily
MSVKGRRKFLKQVGGLAGGAAAATSAYAGRIPSDTSRAENALLLREISAEVEGERPPASTATNNDEKLYPNKIASFSKGLPHSQLGEVDLTAYQSLLTALSTQKHSDAENILIGNGRKLVNPEGAFAYDMEGGDSHTFTAPPAPAFASTQAATEMVELYWQALARDVPFTQWSTSPVIQSAVAEINSIAGYQGPRDIYSGAVTPDTIFRGTATGCLNGPYISQYLMQTVYVGSTPREQKYRTGMPGVDYMTSYSEWLAVQSGSLPASTEHFDPVFRYVRNGRDLAQFVHYDYLVQAFLQAAIVIANSYPETILYYNLYQLNHTSPYKISRIQTPFTTFSAPHVEDWIGRAAGLALKAAWYNKWAVHRRLRPETYGGRVYNTMTGAATYPVPASLLHSQAVQTVVHATGGALLPQAYVEGCPLHPSYPAAHAAVAAACATVLKAIFEETAVIAPTMTLSTDATALIPYLDTTLTIGGELNKLAFNVSMGRNWAGVNYRSDITTGFMIGEEAAISFLEDQVNTLSESFTGFSFTRFDGTPVSIAPQTGPYNGLNILTPGS